MNNRLYIYRTFFSCLICMAASVSGDNPVITSKGIGAKALGMGNSFTAVADDFTAVYWNPGGLAFLPVREVQVSMGALRNDTECDLGGRTEDAGLQRFYFGHAGLLRSVPTDQGGFAFAVGISNPYVFDNVYSFKGKDIRLGPGRMNDLGLDMVYLFPGDTLEYGQAKNFSYGRLSLINLAAGWQVAPGLGIGLAVSPVLGRERQTTTFETYTNGGLFEYSREKILRCYIGLDTRAGILFRPGERFRLGIRMQPPQFVKVYQQYEYQDLYEQEVEGKYKDEGWLFTSFEGAVGAAFRLPFMVISSDVDFRAPFPDAEDGSLRSFWNLGVSSGVEVPITPISSLVRAGYSWSEVDPYHYELNWDNDPFPYGLGMDVVRDRHMITAGYAFMFQDYLMIEASYAFSMWKYGIKDPEWATPVKEDHKSHQALISFSLRY